LTFDDELKLNKQLNFLLTKQSQAMKKQNLLKLALVSLAMFVFMGVQAQPAAILTDYEDVAEDIYQTTGLNFTLIALPDLVYSTGYVAATNTGYNALSEWLWKFDGADWDAATAIGTWSSDNFVEINANWGTPADDVTPSTRLFRVKERFNVAGACESTVVEEMTVAIVATPVVTAFAGTNVSGLWTEDAVGVEFSYCGETISDELSLTFTEFGSLAGLREYTYGITVLRTAYDGAMAPIVGQIDVPVTGTYGQVYDLDAMVAGYDQTFTIPADMVMYLDGATPRPTEYKYTITANSIGSKISRVSEYRHDDALAYVPYNDIPAVTVTYWLYPTPTTGPIYHIPNDFSGY